MASGPRRRLTGSSRPDDLVAVAFDDAVLDRLAARSRRSSSHHARWVSDGDDDAVSQLFADWQERLLARPQPAPLSTDRAAELVAAGGHRSSLRPALAIAAAICALLVGAAAIGARSARPGDPLFPVTQVLWSDQADSAVAGQQVRDAINSAKAALAAGHPEHAADLLRMASQGMVRITDLDDRAAVQQELNTVWRTVHAAAGDGQLAIGLPGTTGGDLAAGQAGPSEQAGAAGTVTIVAGPGRHATGRASTASTAGGGSVAEGSAAAPAGQAADGGAGQSDPTQPPGSSGAGASGADQSASSGSATSSRDAASASTASAPSHGSRTTSPSSPAAASSVAATAPAPASSAPPSTSGSTAQDSPSTAPAPSQTATATTPPSSSSAPSTSSSSSTALTTGPSPSDSAQDQGASQPVDPPAGGSGVSPNAAGGGESAQGGSVQLDGVASQVGSADSGTSSPPPTTTTTPPPADIP